MEYIKKNRNTILIILIAIIIIAGVSVGSYAFFNYNRVGVNHRVLTGKISIKFEEEADENIYLTNQFPIADSLAVTNSLKGASSDVAELSFQVKGKSSVELPYTIYGIAGDTETGKNRFPDKYIVLYLTVNTASQYQDHIMNELETRFFADGSDSDPIYYGDYISEEAIFDEEPIIVDTSVANTKFEIGTGIIQSETEEVHNYTLRMWVGDIVTISDTDPDSTFCASTVACKTAGKPVYSTMYYSLKLKLEVNSNASITQ